MVKHSWYVTLDGREFLIATAGNDVHITPEGALEPQVLKGALAREMVPFDIGGNHTGQIAAGSWLHMWMNSKLYIDGYDVLTGDPLPTPVNHALVGAISGVLGFLFGLLILVPMLICCAVCCIVHRNDVHRVGQPAAPKRKGSDGAATVLVESDAPSDSSHLLANPNKQLEYA